MTEQGPKPIDLTRQANLPKLGGGDIFMAEGGEGSKPDLRGAELRQRLRGSRLGRMAGFRGRPQTAAETPPAPPASPPGEEDGNGNGEQNPQQEQRQGTRTQTSEARTFRPSTEWQEIPEGVAIPEGATIRMDTRSGKNYAKWDNPPDVEIEYRVTEENTGADGERPSISRTTTPPSGETIDKTGITDPQILNIIDIVNKAVNAGTPLREVFAEALNRVFSLEEVDETQRYEAMARMTSAYENTPEQRREGLYGERKLLNSEKTQISNAENAEQLEQLFNRMFDRVDARPQAEFSEAFGNDGVFEFAEFMKTLNEAITHNNGLKPPNVERARKLNLIVQQFANERKAREIIHNAYYGVMAGLNTEKVSGFIDGFMSGWADTAFNKPGVTQAMHFYEQALLIVRESAGGYLKPAEVVGEMKTNREGKVNELARDLLNRANAAGQVKNVNGEPLEPWQIDRALAFARGMSIITGRTIEIAASSILPPGLESFTDQYAQRIISELAPFRHAFKFFVRSKFSRVLAYTMNRGRKPWTTKDIQDFDDLENVGNEQINVLNALVPEGKERLYSVLNPLEIGGILSRTGWRITEGEATIINGLVSAVGGKGHGDEAWIGTGVQIERKRGALVNKKDKKHTDAVRIVEGQLIKIGERTPLRLFLTIRSLQTKILDEYLEESGVDVKKLAKENPDDLKKLRSEYVEKLTPSLTELALFQEESNQAQKESVDISGASEATQDLVKRIRRVWNEEGERNKFLKTLEEKEWMVPYTFGTDDVPYDQYSFETTGPRSVARRWGDMASAAKSSKALSEFVSDGIEHFSSMEEVVKAMRPIYDGIKGYNEEDAKKFILKLAEGVMKFYGKDYKARLPLGIGSLMDIVTGKSSYAQIAYGRGAMAWDELQLNEFTRLLRDEGMLTLDQQHELQVKAGGGKKEVVWGYIRTVAPLIMLGIAVYMSLKVAKEERH
ncbi:MAG: hypothetical protein M1450_01725 [Patescibacteria group bacterium]|nr:hypothetical protein [Patescibacteria group bacterium]